MVDAAGGRAAGGLGRPGLGGGPPQEIHWGFEGPGQGLRRRYGIESHHCTTFVHQGDQCTQAAKGKGLAAARSQEVGAQRDKIGAQRPEEGKVPLLGRKAAQLDGKPQFPVELGKVRQHGRGGRSQGYAEHNLRGEIAIGGEEVLGHGRPVTRILQRRLGHGKQKPGARALVEGLKLPHVQSRCRGF